MTVLGQAHLVAVPQLELKSGIVRAGQACAAFEHAEPDAVRAAEEPGGLTGGRDVLDTLAPLAGSVGGEGAGGVGGQSERISLACVEALEQRLI